MWLTGMQAGDGMANTQNHGNCVRVKRTEEWCDTKNKDLDGIYVYDTDRNFKSKVILVI